MGAANTRPQELAWNKGTKAQKQLLLPRLFTSFEAAIKACRKFDL